MTIKQLIDENLMTVKQLIDELSKYDGDTEVVTSDGYGGIDPIFKVSSELVNDWDDIVPVDWLDSSQRVIVIGWNH
jgi:hypothetical protein